MAIPKIIHQIWSSKYEPLSPALQELGESWKNQHPGWDYKFWDEPMLDEFVEKHYPHLVEKYRSFPYDIQRWDAVRYLILYIEGGLYADFDYECMENMEPLLKTDCCFATEPAIHFNSTADKIYFTNGLFAADAGHPFIRYIIENIFAEIRLPKENESSFSYCLDTTGLGMISGLYLTYKNKKEICLMPEELVSPFNKREIELICMGHTSAEIDERVQKAYAIHYFSGRWVSQLHTSIK